MIEGAPPDVLIGFVVFVAVAITAMYVWLLGALFWTSRKGRQ